jgi:hypothetical protein
LNTRCRRSPPLCPYSGRHGLGLRVERSSAGPSR